MQIFYAVAGVPVHSVLNMVTRERALNYRRGDIRLGCCEICGFICNLSFDPTAHEYSLGYEGTQSYSPTFNTFHTRLAQQLIERYDVHNKHIIEIGCGQGEFLILLCELGGNQGIGFDPAYDSSRPRDYDPAQVKFVPDFYSEKYTQVQGDLVCCKMTLEHIAQTAEFVHMVRRSIADRLETVVFFQVPNASYILQDVAFWDIYYEHCSYFSAGSLAYLFEQSGFEVLNLMTEYDDQYLTIEAKPLASARPISAETRQAVAETRQAVNRFIEAYPSILQGWERTFERLKNEGKRVVTWGGGSKAVAFLTTLAGSDVVRYAVDVNPYRRGTFLAGVGQEIVGPEFLRTYQPDVVIIMNPIYCDEIQRTLHEMGLAPQVLTV